MGDQRPEPSAGITGGATVPRLPVNEPRRLAAPNRYGLPDTPPEQTFDPITRLAAGVPGMPVWIHRRSSRNDPDRSAGRTGATVEAGGGTD